MKKINPGNFPVIFKILDGYLVMSAPDFGIIIKKRFDAFRQAEEIGNLYLDLVRKIDEEIKAISRRKGKIPEVRRLKDVLPKDTLVNYSVKEMSRVMGVSEDTIRRMSDEGTLSCKVTRGGHRRFSQEEMDRILANETHVFEERY